MKTILGIIAALLLLSASTIAQDKQMVWSYGFDASGDYYNETGVKLDSLGDADSTNTVYWKLTDFAYATATDSILGQLFLMVDTPDTGYFVIQSLWGMEGFTDGSFSYATENPRLIDTLLTAGDTLAAYIIKMPAGIQFPPERMALKFSALAAHDSATVILPKFGYPKVYQNRSIDGNDQ